MGNGDRGPITFPKGLLGHIGICYSVGLPDHPNFAKLIVSHSIMLCGFYFSQEIVGLSIIYIISKQYRQSRNVQLSNFVVSARIFDGNKNKHAQANCTDVRKINLRLNELNFLGFVQRSLIF